MFWKEWYESGIVYIQDIMKENAFLEYEELCQRYSFRPNYLRYFSLIKAIKSQVNHDRNIENIVSNEKPTPHSYINSSVFETNTYDRVDVKKAKSKVYCDLFIQKCSEPSTAVTK